MKAVLISIKPKWCELITLGKKTVDVRKTKPKLETPFKCYIYQTKIRWAYSLLRKLKLHNLANILESGTGKIIGEFVCDWIDEFIPTEKGVSFKRFSSLFESRLSVKQMRSYLNGKVGYGWHISNLIIYGKPRKLNAFKTYYVGTYLEDGYPMPTHEIKRPPQSWCYVERMDDDYV